MKTVADIMSEAAVRLDDEGNRRFTATTLRTWINEGAKEIARRTECLRAESTIAVSANTQTVTGPTDLVRIHHAQYEPTGQNQKYPLTYQDRRNMDPIWGVSQSISTGAYPEYYTTWGVPPSLSITLAPVPTSAGNLRVFYYRLPVTVASDGSDDADTIDLPAGWEDLITTYVEARGYRKDRRLDDYQLAMQDFTNQMLALMQTAARFSDSPGAFSYDVDWPGLSDYYV